MMPPVETVAPSPDRPSEVDVVVVGGGIVGAATAFYLRARGCSVMLCEKGIIGGEQSGHIILSDYTTTGDGLIAALQLLSVVKQMDRPVSEVCHCFDPLPQILKNVRYANGKPLEKKPVVSAIEAARQMLGESGRLVIRPSGTEPVIRVMAEGDDRDLVMRAVDDIVDAVTKAAA